MCSRASNRLAPADHDDRGRVGWPGSDTGSTAGVSKMLWCGRTSTTRVVMSGTTTAMPPTLAGASSRWSVTTRHYLCELRGQLAHRDLAPAASS